MNSVPRQGGSEWDGIHPVFPKPRLRADPGIGSHDQRPNDAGAESWRELAPGQSRIGVKRRCPESSRVESREYSVPAECEERTETRRARSTIACRSVRVCAKACYFLRCRMRLRMRRFLRPTLRRPLPRRRLAMRSPLGSRKERNGIVRDAFGASGIDRRADSIRKSIKVSQARLVIGHWSLVTGHWSTKTDSWR